MSMEGDLLQDEGHQAVCCRAAEAAPRVARVALRDKFACWRVQVSDGHFSALVET